MTSSRDAEHFRRLYRASPDPWRFRTSPYEQAKYRHTIAALGTRRFHSAFEPGCSIGELTRLLAAHCDQVLAMDLVEEPLRSAKATCADLPGVRFVRAGIPQEWPTGRYDLIVLSEVLYFLSPSDIEVVADRAVASLARDGVVLMVNWRGRSGDPCTGDEAADIFLRRAGSALAQSQHYSEPAYRLDLMCRTPV